MSKYNQSTKDQLTKDQLLTAKKIGSTNYKKYYESGTYDGRFDPKRPTYRREEDLIIDTFKASFFAFKIRTTHQNKLSQDFHLLDLGCGSGRTIGMVLYIAEKLSQKSIGLTFVGIDPEQAGLDIYKERLIEKGFALNTAVKEKTIELSRGNVKFKLMVGDQHKVAELDETFDMSMSMFGVLSHIKGRANRIEALNIINNKTCGFLAITIAGYNGFRDRIKLFADLRKVSGEWARAIEEGDFQYTIANSDECNYYHAEHFNGAKEEAASAGYKVTKVGVSSILHPSKIPGDTVLGQIDKFASKMVTRVLPPKNASELSCYIELCGKSSQLLDLESGIKDAQTPSPRTIKKRELQPLMLGTTTSLQQPL